MGWFFSKIDFTDIGSDDLVRKEKMMGALYDFDVRIINYHLKKYLATVNEKRIQLLQNLQQLPLTVKNIK